MTFQEFEDPRLVALYDAWGVGREDTAFWLALAREVEAATVVDIGCGTGEITVALAQQGSRVTGVDPSRAMLEVARSRPGGDLVRWIEGDASRLGGDDSDGPADLAIMTAHVSQVIHDEVAWRRTLAQAHRALRPGGTLAFESRNPAARGWLHWTPASRRRLDHPSLGAVEVWVEVVELRAEAAGDLVCTRIHYLFASGEELTSDNTLRFRSQAAITGALAQAGFSVRAVYGDWDRSPVLDTSPELIFVANRE